VEVEVVEPESAVVDEGGSVILAGGLASIYIATTAKLNSHNIRDHRSAGACSTQLSGTVKSILGRGEHRWGMLSAVYASDICQFRGSESGLCHHHFFLAACD
jgi:hypothetical protein